MTHEQLVAAFNEWMRRFVEDPSGYSREFEQVTEFLNDEANGVEPSYGESCAAYLTKLVAEQIA